MISKENSYLLKSVKERVKAYSNSQDTFLPEKMAYVPVAFSWWKLVPLFFLDKVAVNKLEDLYL